MEFNFCVRQTSIHGFHKCLSSAVIEPALSAFGEAIATIRLSVVFIAHLMIMKLNMVNLRFKIACTSFESRAIETKIYLRENKTYSNDDKAAFTLHRF